MPSSQSVLLKAKGLYTHSNPLSATPEGSLKEARNLVIDRNEILEQRRGFMQYGNSFGIGADRAKQLINYKDRILRHVINSIQYDNDGNGEFFTFSGPSISESEPGLRIKSIEANGNLYLTSSTGLKKISASSASDFNSITITDAGGIKALDLIGSPNFSQSGFMPANSKTAYRLVWGIYDLNENLILGAPSARYVVMNATTSSCIVDINFFIPPNITSTDYFYQLYRTPVYDAPMGQEPIDPGEEFYLVLENNVTSLELSAGEINLQDITPEDFRKNGTLLYTNPVSGEGILQSNERPPFSKDICLYKGYTFLSNTKTAQRLNLSFLSITGLVSNVSNIVISDGTTTNTYTFQGAMETYTADYTGSVFSDYYNSSPSIAKYFTLTSANDEHSYYVWYYKTLDDEDPAISGMIGIKVDISSLTLLSELIDATITQINTDTSDFNMSAVGPVLTIECSNNGYVTNSPSENITNFTIIKDGNGLGEDSINNKIFLPKVPNIGANGPTTSMQLEQVARSLVHVFNAQDDIVYAYYNSGFSDIPGQIFFEQQDITGPAFYFTSTNGTQFNPLLPTSGSTVISANEIRPNRLYYSKYQQPEAFPLANYIDIGPKDREIKRVIALRDSLFILKEDGIYRLSGESAPFAIAPFDFSAQVLAPDTAVVLNNQIYALSTQGVIVITDTGVTVISRPIENLLLQITRQGYNYKTASFGVSYETDRAYHLWTVTNLSDTSATQCFRYNTFTSAWTRWDINKTCGIVNFANDKMYLGAGDTNIIEIERKTLTRIDHADREYLVQVLLNGVQNEILNLNTINNMEIGDVLIQKQYLTPNQFNRLLRKLDNDTGVNDTDYFSSIEFSTGQDMRLKLELLASKLDNDSGITQTDYFTVIDNYNYTITNITPSGNQAILTIGLHQLEIGRYIVISSSDSTPSIDGTYEIIDRDSTTITINKTLTSGGTTGLLQTSVNDFRDMQTCYNIITYKLNNDVTVFYTNYPTSANSVDAEIIILSIDSIQNSITGDSKQNLIAGNMTHYKAIESEVIWNPNFFGDPSVAKQVREGTLLFENTNYSLATIAYSSDQSPSFVNIDFNGVGKGDWGQFHWGGINWGGIGAPIPLRTYIPATKQRCRFLNVKFMHKVALEKFNIYGLSLTFRPYSIRTNK